MAIAIIIMATLFGCWPRLGWLSVVHLLLLTGILESVRPCGLDFLQLEVSEMFVGNALGQRPGILRRVAFDNLINHRLDPFGFGPPVFCDLRVGDGESLGDVAAAIVGVCFDHAKIPPLDRALG